MAVVLIGLLSLSSWVPLFLVYLLEMSLAGPTWRHDNWWLGWAIVVTIIWLSVTPAPIDIGVKAGDKLGHLAAYGWVMFWFAQIYHRRATRLSYAGAFVAMGIALEFVQLGLGYRTFEVMDMVADALGVTHCSVRSHHHQAVADLAPKAVATAWSDDGMNEGFELPEGWVVSVQDDEVTVRIADNVKVKMVKSGIAQNLTKIEALNQPKAETAEKK